ncbi:hypothetical protein LTR85_009381 [Meristemomyces frigidus]|nr:hypothetical protein LTR85_009381 [Meristemomyces frigidus]
MTIHLWRQSLAENGDMDCASNTTGEHLLDLHVDAREAGEVRDIDNMWNGTEEPWPPTEAEHVADDFDILQPPGIPTSDDVKQTDASTHVSMLPLQVEDDRVAVESTSAEGRQRLLPLAGGPVSTQTMDPRVLGASENIQDDELGSSIEDYASRYELRPQSSRAGFVSTWIDKDDTGNYEPSEEFRRPKARRNRLKFRERDYVGSIFDSADEEAVSGAGGPLERLKLIAELKFSSEAGKKAFREHVSNLPAKRELERDAFSTGYRLRKKTSTAASRHAIAQHLDRPADAPDVPDDLTGHPIARGCWECLGLGIRCPLLDDEHGWPCVTCLEDDHDCDLVTPPVRKRACERCKRTRKPCSYNETFDHSGPCEDCANGGFRCVAGPLKESVRTRIRYDRDWEKDPLLSKKADKPKKTYWTCQQCREAGRSCSFSNGGSGEDCTFCSEMDSICIPEKVATPQHHRATPRSAMAPKKRIAREPAEQQTPTKQAKTSPHSAGTTRTIMTKYCHPMIFNHEDIDGTKPCDFCEHYSFAILGMEPKEVAVIDWADGRGLTEVGGGHMEGGIASTRMCTTCTMRRMPIVICPKHEMRPIPGTSLETIDIDGALMALFSDEEREKDRWCSICPSLATYECETGDSMDALGEPCDGCGLSLCEQCMLNLTGVHDGDLQAMLVELKDEPSAEKPLGLRADHDLLKQDGLLMRHVLWSTQQ